MPYLGRRLVSLPEGGSSRVDCRISGSRTSETAIADTVAGGGLSTANETATTLPANAATPRRTQCFQLHRRKQVKSWAGRNSNIRKRHLNGSHLGHVSNFCHPAGPVIEPMDDYRFDRDPCGPLTRVHGGHPVWTRFELAEGSPITSGIKP